MPAGRATATMQSLAVAHGADLRERTPVRALRPVGGEVDVVTDEGAVRCGTVILAADAWTRAPRRATRPVAAAQRDANR